ncbi:hypothetical protein SARC_12810 [Sphaeroforma arctica JP610]|uniref:RING finger and CHY zinc finger domain-containing protein 1 n=1 Tax=Sphaeroforma arctica JP610 TaxID=667725 RepID=A0A0L0FD34_9EUKA|nr:hypothetical protein SARC_12810 [Sphaeroforma arctica JP610]KNC74650.1 hypothetical protein SARC_12810 [Sphaeroforma arctica JP610]|eukprot:XP_014148552.1 hypothetical protein SARC_12810 [Sphaeroforma arctica JP610]
MRDQVMMRALIMKVHADTTLSAHEKAHRVQRLMTSTYNEKLKASNESLKQESPGRRSLCPQFRPKLSSTTPSTEVVGKVMGCKHYARACKIQAPCCKEWYTCRLCHDESNDHKMNRHEVTNMYCMYCNREQEAAKSCKFADCGMVLANYHCGTCNLWDDDATKKIYHCDDCGLCRIGEGLGKDFFHCNKCNVCMAVSLKGKHKCIERNLESDCPICSEFMFTSTSTIIFMRCGHCIHHACYEKHVTQSYQCPICLKSLGNMKSYFDKIEEIMVSNPMPVEYQDSKSNILCNDCEMKSTTKYHFMHHKCSECASYNTTVLNIEHGSGFGQNQGTHTLDAIGGDNMVIDGGE